MRVFIDANIYLKLFNAKPSQTYFNDLKRLLKERKFDLVFPRVTRNEVYHYVGENLKKEEKLELSFIPAKQKFDNEKANQKFKEISDKFQSDWKKLQQELKEELQNNLKIKKEMAADLFGQFLKETIDFDDSPDLISKAEQRMLKRYPPGKYDLTHALGDELAWEILLAHCIDDDLTIVSDDSDWQDILDSKKINPFLLEEWENTKTEKKIQLFDDLGDLISNFDKKYIKPKEEIEKEKTSLSNYPWISVSPSASSFASLSYPGTFTVSSSSSPSISASTTTTSGIYSTGVAFGSTNPQFTCRSCGRGIDTGYIVMNNIYCNDCVTNP